MSYLGEDYDYRAGVGKRELEMGVEIVDGPGYIDTSPFACDCPFRTKESCAINVLKMPQKILVRNPEFLVTRKLHDVN